MVTKIRVNTVIVFCSLQVSILPPIRIEFTRGHPTEYPVGTEINMDLAITTFLTGLGEEAMYTSCSGLPYEVKLSDTENFEFVKRSGKGNSKKVTQHGDLVFKLTIINSDVELNGPIFKLFQRRETIHVLTAVQTSKLEANQQKLMNS